MTATTQRACRVCGCTDDEPCTGEPCSWIEDDLCSDCVDLDDGEFVCRDPDCPCGGDVDAPPRRVLTVVPRGDLL